MASGVYFSFFFGSFVFGETEFPISDMPLMEIVNIIIVAFQQDLGATAMWSIHQLAIRLIAPNSIKDSANQTTNGELMHIFRNSTTTGDFSLLC